LYYLTHRDDNTLYCIKTAADCSWQRRPVSLFTHTYQNTSTVFTPTTFYS